MLRDYFLDLCFHLKKSDTKTLKKCELGQWPKEGSFFPTCWGSLWPRAGPCLHTGMQGQAASLEGASDSVAM